MLLLRCCFILGFYALRRRASPCPACRPLPLCRTPPRPAPPFPHVPRGPQGIVHSPSLEALAAAAEQAEAAGIVPGAGDPLRGRQLGRIALLKKEFGFIRQVAEEGIGDGRVH